MKELRLPFSLLLICVMLIPSLLQAQDNTKDNTLRNRYGILGNYNLNRHSSDFSQLPGVTNCCPDFEDGEGIGFTAGLLFELPYNERLSVILRTIYAQYNADFTDDEQKTMLHQGEPTDIITTHDLTTELSDIALEALISVKPIGNFSLTGGFYGGYIFGKKIEQDEKLKSPSNLTFDNGRKVRYPSSRDIQDASAFRAALTGGISYDIAFDKDNTIIVAPEILYTYGLSPLVPSLTWNADMIRFGLSVKFSPLPKKPEIEEEIEEPEPPSEPEIAQEDTRGATEDFGDLEGVKIEPESQLVKVDVSAYFYENDTEKQLSSLDITGKQQELFPILPYIFFNENSSELPDRYILLNDNEADNFKISDIENSSRLETYYNVLNIIGRRMQSHPDAKLTITGCNSNTGDEQGNTELSSERASAVYRYLNEVRNITPDRLIVQSRNLPKHPSKPDEADGIAENRRVEITSDTWQITAPLFLENDRDVRLPEKIVFKPELDTTGSIEGWKLDISTKEKIIKTFEDTGVPPKEIVWKINEKEFPTTANSLNYVMEVDQKGGIASLSSQKTITIENIRDDKQNSSNNPQTVFRLILFDFDEADTDNFDKRTIELINNRISGASEVLVKGYADRLGEEDYNLRLSRRRAKAVANFLNHSKIKTKGMGESQKLFNNDLPEGRFYNRTVEIVVNK